jgi:hypothetical protein
MLKRDQVIGFQKQRVENDPYSMRWIRKNFRFWYKSNEDILSRLYSFFSMFWVIETQTVDSITPNRTIWKWL